MLRQLYGKLPLRSSPKTHPKTLFALCAGAGITLLLILRYSFSSGNASFYSGISPPRVAGTSLKDQEFPKKLWQSWKDDSEDPTERTVGFPHKWRLMNPQHRYERLTDANMDAYIQSRFNESPRIMETFLNLTDHIMRADMLRYMVMLADGGVWADIDVLPHKPISAWTPPEFQKKTNLVIGVENDHNKQPIWPGSPYSVQLAQYTILAKPHHPAIHDLVDQVVDNLRGFMASQKSTNAVHTFQDVMSMTGPFVFTDVLMKYFARVTNKVYTGDELSGLTEPTLIGDVLVLPKDCFGWLPHENTHPKEYILVEHLFIGTWRDGHPG